MTYLPVKGEPFTVSMGLRTLDFDKWIEIDEEYEVELTEKRELLTNRKSEVFAALPGGLAGSVEVLEKLIPVFVSQVAGIWLQKLAQICMAYMNQFRTMKIESVLPLMQCLLNLLQTDQFGGLTGQY
jgi:hypothetical protein